MHTMIATLTNPLVLTRTQFESLPGSMRPVFDDWIRKGWAVVDDGYKPKSCGHDWPFVIRVGDTCLLGCGATRD